MTAVEYAQLDPPVVALVQALNSLPGITTFASCGGHENPGPCGQPADRWSVAFMLDQDDDLAPTAEAWVSLEWLAWVFHDMRMAGRRLMLTCDALPPFVNRPGRMLRFAFEGSRDSDRGLEPDHLAAFITDKAPELYVHADDARELWGDT